MDCRGFDGQVARLDSALRRLTDRFVCVRLVSMNGVDLNQFQFDYDMTWTAFFLNADGTVYARYGSRTVEGPMVTNSREGLMETMKRVLEAHREYPSNERLFAAKRGPQSPYARPEDIPAKLLRGRGGAVTRGSCIHCHEVHEALHEVEREERDGFPAVIFKFPFPENVGLEVDPLTGTDVLGVRPGSAAEKAGLERGDRISTLDSQAILSLADFQFVLHHLRTEARIPVTIERDRDGTPVTFETTLELDGDWRTNDFTWRTSMNGFPPDSGLYLRTLDAGEKRRLGIPERQVGLEVGGLFEDVVRKSDLRYGDIITAYDGRTETLSAPRFKDYLRVRHFRPGSVLRLEVLREGERRNAEVRF